jgi:hypothetical protein
MTTLNYVLMLVGFGLWFYAGHNAGKSKVRIKERKYEERQAPPPPKLPRRATKIEITIK